MPFDLRRHRAFLAVLGVSVLLRLDALAGYRFVLGSVDSAQYLGHAVAGTPSPIRPVGYSLFLDLLPGMLAVAVVQHLLALATATAMYALLRGRFELPAWAATLAAGVCLLEAFQLYLCQAVGTEALFGVLVTGAVLVLLWRDRPGTALAAAGLGLLALAALVRTVGLLPLGVALLWLAARRVNWRVLAAAAAAAALPLAGYAVWYHGTYGRFGLTGFNGIFLYGKTMTFADCAKIPLTARQRRLCPSEPVGRRPRPRTAAYYISGATGTPLGRIGRFGPGTDDLAGSFARAAILAQPGDYLREVGRDVAYGLVAPSVPAARGPYGWFYRFPPKAALRDPRIALPPQNAHAYDPGYRGLRIVEPFAALLRGYQWLAGLPDLGMAALLLLGAVGAVRHRAALLPWSVAVTLLVGALATSDYDPRYPAVCLPVACLAAAFAAASIRRDRPGALRRALALSRSGG